MPLLPILRSLITLGKGTVGGLSMKGAGAEPIALFRKWFDDAERSHIFLPNACAVATSTLDGTPSLRMMLLKSFDEEGFTLYTNYMSRKGKELDTNPKTAVLLYWNVLQRQVRIEGRSIKLSEESSFLYFQTRPRGSRIGAWASNQSAVLKSRDELERRFREYERRFREDDEVPLPPFWGGYRLIPERIEFWQGRSNRLHDRILFTRRDPSGAWEKARLSP